jgi:hypothetical protein
MTVHGEWEPMQVFCLDKPRDNPDHGSKHCIRIIDTHHLSHCGPVESKLRESPAGLLSFECAGLLPFSSTTTISRSYRPTVTFASTHYFHGASIAQSRILQKMQEYAIDIIIHLDQHFDAFRDGGTLFNKIPAACFIQSQNGARISQPTNI